MDLSAWRDRHGENSLVESIRTSNVAIFTALLESRVDVNLYDHIQDKSDEPPTLPIHVAAMNPDPFFLRVLIQRGADPDDDRQDPRSCSNNEPAFDNTFRSAVRAGIWENVKTVIESGGVHGGFDSGVMWEVRNDVLRNSVSVLEDADLADEILRDMQELFGIPWYDLLQLAPPDGTRLPNQQSLWNTIGFTSLDPSDDEILQEWTDLDWVISTQLPHLDDAHRLHVVDDLLRGGAEIACYTTRSHLEMWNRRAGLIADNGLDPADHFSSPIRSLDSSYHTVFTPLHTCVLRKNTHLLSHLITNWHFNPHIPEFLPRAYSPLFLALSRQDLETSNVLVEAGGADQLEYISPIMHSTVLHIAADTRSTEVFNWVLAKLSTLDAANREKIFEQRSRLGHTPLHIACLPPFIDFSDFSEPDHPSPRPAYATNSPGAVDDDQQLLQAFADLVISAGGGRWNWDDRDHLGVTVQQYWNFSSIPRSR